MCIPKEFIGDGKYDCATKMDENILHKDQLKTFNDSCFFKIYSTRIRNTIILKSNDSCLNVRCIEGYYKCLEQNYCIAIEFICNGVEECFYGDDEIHCSMFLLR